MFVQDMGNNESLSRGVFKNNNGTFTAMTFSESKTFKTFSGAEKWMSKRGYSAEGKRI